MEHLKNAGDGFCAIVIKANLPENLGEGSVIAVAAGVRDKDGAALLRDGADEAFISATRFVRNIERDPSGRPLVDQVMELNSLLHPAIHRGLMDQEISCAMPGLKGKPTAAGMPPGIRGMSADWNGNILAIFEFDTKAEKSLFIEGNDVFDDDDDEYEIVPMSISEVQEKLENILTRILKEAAPGSFAIGSTVLPKAESSIEDQKAFAKEVDALAEDLKEEVIEDMSNAQVSSSQAQQSPTEVLEKMKEVVSLMEVIGAEESVKILQAAAKTKRKPGF